jgi:hypothetical protein
MNDVSLSSIFFYFGWLSVSTDKGKESLVIRCCAGSADSLSGLRVRVPEEEVVLHAPNVSRAISKDEEKSFFIAGGIFN